jgi:hypothetical protein
MFCRLADELEESFDLADRVAEVAGDAASDAMAVVRTDVAFRQWAARHGVRLFDDVEVATPDE